MCLVLRKDASAASVGSILRALDADCGPLTAIDVEAAAPVGGAVAVMLEPHS